MEINIATGTKFSLAIILCTQSLNFIPPVKDLFYFHSFPLLKSVQFAVQIWNKLTFCVPSSVNIVWIRWWLKWRLRVFHCGFSVVFLFIFIDWNILENKTVADWYLDRFFYNLTLCCKGYRRNGTAIKGSKRNT
jgi:hypothetical protein